MYFSILNAFLVSFLLITISVELLSAQQVSKCSAATEKEIDNIVARILTVGTERAYPKDKPEFKSYCKEQIKMIQKVEAYKNECLKSRAKSVVAVIIYSIRQITNSYCKHPNSKRVAELLQSAECANQAKTDYNICNKEYIGRLIQSKGLKDSKERLAQICCGYQQIFKCVREQGNKHPEICTEDRIEANVDYIRGFFDNAINAGCGDYTGDSDKCDSVAIPPIKKSKKALPKSYFSPLVQILSNI